MQRAALGRNSGTVLAKKPRLPFRNDASLSRVTAMCFDAVTEPFALRPRCRRVAEARRKTPATSPSERSGAEIEALLRLSNPSEGVCLPIGDGELPLIYRGIELRTLISQFASA